MANLFRDNAYNVLGLDISVAQKEINKRSKEIVNLLRIDEESTYEIDISVAKPKRTESTVKEAVQKLSSPTKKIQEYFFWFDIESDTDEKALKLLQSGSIDEAIQLWEKDSGKETATGFVAKKNLAILFSVLLVDKGQKKYLTQSISCWKDLVMSEKFWSYFEKIYALNDEVGTSSSAIKDFESKVTDVLSDFYTDISQTKGDNSFYSLFAQVFDVKGLKMQRDVLSPIYEAINDTSEKLRNLNISEDNIVSPEEITELKRLTKLLQTNFDKLKELGLFSDSQSKTMRDKAAEALRAVALDLHNNLGESEKPVALFNIASKIAGTTATINKINKDIETLRQNRSDEKIIKPINDLLEDEKFTDALDLIEKRMESHKSNKELMDFLTARLKWAITGIAAKDYKETMQQFTSGHFAKAEQNFSGLREFLLSYIHYFNFNQEAINEVLAEIDQLTGDPKALNIDNVQNYRNKLLEGTEETFKDSFESSLIVFLVDCGIYGNMAAHLPAIKRKNTIKKWLWYIVIGIILLVIFGSSSDSSDTNSTSGSSSSSSSSAWQICSDEYDRLKNELDSVEASMRRYESFDDADGYNALVPRQNSLVQLVNNKATECNGLR